MITSLRLQNFRSYKDSSFEFDPGINIVVGPNASGKSNLLEAIEVLSSGSSYRARDTELIKHGEQWARLDGRFGSDQRVAKLSLDGQAVKKVFELDEKPFKRLSLERTEPAVLFEPEHLQLINRGPENRRDFFDGMLERSQAGFKTLANQYRRLLTQRNALLKQPPVRAKGQLFAWNIRLSEVGGQIAAARYELAEDINRSLSRTYGKIAGKRTRVRLKYDAEADPLHYSSRLLKKLEQAAETDLMRGFTSHGPHREDFTIYIKEQPAASVASRGEIRSLVLALKVYELKLVEQRRGAKPIFLLDDVFSELDAARRRHLVEYLKDYQTIITTTDADAVMEYFADNNTLLSV